MLDAPLAVGGEEGFDVDRQVVPQGGQEGVAAAGGEGVADGRVALGDPEEGGDPFGTRLLDVLGHGGVAGGVDDGDAVVGGMPARLVIGVPGQAALPEPAAGVV